MAKEYSRAVRVGEQIHRELSDLIRRELHDPRVGMVTIASVDVSPDLYNAKVFFTVLGDDAKVAQSLAALNRAAGFLRHELGQRLRFRVLPQLRFAYDESERRASRVDSLLAAAKVRAGSTAPDPDDA